MPVYRIDSNTIMAVIHTCIRVELVTAVTITNYPETGRTRNMDRTRKRRGIKLVLI